MDLVYRCHFTSPRIIWRRRWRGICHCRAGVELNRKKQVVFLGSPTVAANVLDKLLDASHLKGSIFDVSAIVTQPASGRLRGRKDIPSPVAQRALDRSFSSDRIFTPEKAGEEKFLADLRELKPDLCVTAAYGNILPNRFLEIPKHGTVNIHPSLLPLYRGAAPVQRALQDGVQVTGVSVAFTVRALDAGPIIACESLEIDDSVKVSTEESWLCFDQPALMLHNTVRAFAGWPGTKTKVEIYNDTTNETETVELKIVTTKVGLKDCHMNICSKDILLDGDALIFLCGGGSKLEVMRARDFWNGLRGRKLFKA